MQPLWKIVGRFLRKLKIELLYDLAIPLLGIYPDKTTVQKEACTPMSIAAPFTTAMAWEQPKCPWIEEWIERIWFIYTVGCCAVLSQSVMSKSPWPHELQPARLLCLWGFSRQEYWSGLLCPPPGDPPNPVIEPRSPTLQVDYLPSEPHWKPKNTGVGSLSILEGNFPAQESNWALLHHRPATWETVSGILFSPKKNGIMPSAAKHECNWSLPYMWYHLCVELKYDTNELIYETGTESWM